ncbi:hypothetical protein NPIL_405461 [Nephila pilipes]|uniref:Uncharacterized protein n=1 Tax=Nephila pilipes TaxID=299642 RepID=A0A8X6PHN3_NEPPI|nr:hypothetical protein NPIL_405461 [Nephila pilipes]
MDECNHLVLSSVLAPVCALPASQFGSRPEVAPSGDSTIQYIFSVEEVFKSIVLSLPSILSLTSKCQTSLKRFSQLILYTLCQSWLLHQSS